MSLPSPKPGSGLNTILFDLDGTLAEPTWPRPEIGKPIPKAVKALVDYFVQGFEVVIYTARPKSHQATIATWLDHVSSDGTYHREAIDAIAPLSDIVYDIITDKPRAAMYVDDRAVKFPEEFPDAPVMMVLDRGPDWALTFRQRMWTHERTGFCGTDCKEVA